MLISAMIKYHYLNLDDDREGIQLFQKQLAILGLAILTAMALAGFISLNFLNTILFALCSILIINLSLYFIVMLYDYLS
jgi:hypothetical protein